MLRLKARRAARVTSWWDFLVTLCFQVREWTWISSITRLILWDQCRPEFKKRFTMHTCDLTAQYSFFFHWWIFWSITTLKHFGMEVFRESFKPSHAVRCFYSTMCFTQHAVPLRRGGLWFPSQLGSRVCTGGPVNVCLTDVSIDV